jgi:hypothetical protein
MAAFDQIADQMSADESTAAADDDTRAVVPHEAIPSS